MFKGVRLMVDKGNETAKALYVKMGMENIEGSYDFWENEHLYEQFPKAKKD